jgi:hypothetical protein
MAQVNVRFTADPVLPRDLRDRPYKNGYECEMSEVSANRWVRRGVAVIVPPAAATRIAREVLGPAGRSTVKGGGDDATGSVVSSGTVSSGTEASSGTISGGGTSVGSTGTVAAPGSVTSSGTTGVKL